MCGFFKCLLIRGGEIEPGRSAARDSDCSDCLVDEFLEGEM